MMGASHREQLNNSAIDPAFAAEPDVAELGPIARRELDPDISSLIEAFAARRTRVTRSTFAVFPTARPELLFHFGDPFRVREGGGEWSDLPRAALLGPRRRRYWQAAGPEIDWFLIQLSPLGCRRLLGRKFGDLWSTDLALGTLWGRLAGELHAALAAETVFDRRIAIVEAALAGLGLDPGGDEAISRVGRSVRSGQLRSVSDMAAALGIGERRLHQRFTAEYGMAPKAFLNLMRFNRRLLEEHPQYRRHDPREPGYSDQSHAIREFRRYAGMTPGHYVRTKLAGDALVVTGPPEFL